MELICMSLVYAFIGVFNLPYIYIVIAISVSVIVRKLKEKHEELSRPA